MKKLLITLSIGICGMMGNAQTYVHLDNDTTKVYQLISNTLKYYKGSCLLEYSVITGNTDNHTRKVCSAIIEAKDKSQANKRFRKWVYSNEPKGAKITETTYNVIEITNDIILDF